MTARDTNGRVKYQRERTVVVWSFLLSFVLTASAFIAVAYNWIEQRTTLLLFLVLLAVIQVAVQLYTFMHLKDKGHQFPIFFTLAGAFVAVVFVYGMIEWLWW